MTNTQFAALGDALALIHGELIAIRASCERAEKRAASVINLGTRVEDDESPPRPALEPAPYQSTPSVNGKRGKYQRK